MRICYFLSLVCGALVMGTTFAHTLEMPGKLRVDGPLWTTFQHTLYPAFATVGGTIEIGAIVATWVLAFLTRGTSSFWFNLAGAICFAAAFAVWLFVVAPVNAQTAQWMVEHIPTDWARWRRQWETGHALRFGLHLVGYSFLLISLLRARGPVATLA